MPLFLPTERYRRFLKPRPKSKPIHATLIWGLIVLLAAQDWGGLILIGLFLSPLLGFVIGLMEGLLLSRHRSF